MAPNRTQEVWTALASVTDPEIDESVTSLEFITSVGIEFGSRVHIEFRLPTYWCAPNFAFLMASDMRDAVAELPWVENVSVELLDHFSADLINRGVALRQDFRDAFPGETDDDLREIRQKFLGKAFERRQELLLRHLLAKGYRPSWITRISLRELMGLWLDSEGTASRSLYLFILRKIHRNRTQEHLAFTTLAGGSLDPDAFPTYMRKLAGVRRNAEFNGFICRSLLAARNGERSGNTPRMQVKDTENT
jgi:metal-sulfur cluster biosynthetic enzyme